VPLVHRARVFGQAAVNTGPGAGPLSEPAASSAQSHGARLGNHFFKETEQFAWGCRLVHPRDRGAMMTADRAEFVERSTLPPHQVHANATEQFVAMAAFHARRELRVVGARFHAGRQLGRRRFRPFGNGDSRGYAFHQTAKDPNPDHLSRLGGRLDNRLTIEFGAIGGAQVVNHQTFIR